MKIIGIITAAATALLLVACGGNSSTSARFIPSATPVMPGLVKLVQKSHSNDRVVLDAVLYGPEPALDLFAYRFSVKIGNTGIAKLVPQMDYTQSALVAENGQTISVQVDAASDPTLVQVVVDKQGGGAGNGFVANSVVLIELAFQVNGSGESSLSFVGQGGQPPEVLDHNLAPIGVVTFDPATAGVQAVSTGGGY